MALEPEIDHLVDGDPLGRPGLRPPEGDSQSTEDLDLRLVPEVL